ncbi:interleukin-1 receptor type 2-like isoform X2 [Pelobates cultripes]|uniref:Interleukin-1 receptor type 2-like isoform X2 n=1 Tax=Pelobates cultripes TaxID=61616 RepID=A0AAD1R8B4_PELCU|nr:interleukin-1 receptor type 2-like isoform X2 [Pelobates cultripes]
MPFISRAPAQPALNKLPAILKPENCTIFTKEGGNFTINCTAESTWRDFNLVYWLANNNFIENEFPDGRVSEGPEKINQTQNVYTVQKSLIFSPTKQEDFNTNFTCVIQDPAGVDVKHIILKKEPAAAKV